MTVEAGECNGRCGDLKAEKEMGGSYVIVNGVSGDRREEKDRDRDPAEEEEKDRDRDPAEEEEKKIDLGNGHGIGAKEGESGRLRSENGDLWEIEVKATKNGDGESSRENGEGREEDGVSVSEIPGAQQNELTSAAAETMPELESEMPDAETEDVGGSESRIGVEESEPVTASETFEPVDSVAEIKVLSAQQPEEPVSNELVPAAKVEIEENHDDSSETKSGSDIVFVDAESRRASESIIEVEVAKEPELEENHDNGSGPKSGSDMNVEVHEDEPDTVVVGTENRDESRSQDEDMKMEGKKDDDNDIKSACETKVKILKAKPEIADVEAEDRGRLESPIVVKKSEPVTASEMSVVEGTVFAELDSAAEIEVRSTQQPEDPVDNELVPGMKVEIEENHANSSGTKLASNIVFVDTEGQRESGSPAGVEDVKEPEIEENHDNGLDMKDKPDTVVVGTENCDESALHVEVEDVKEQKLAIVSESVVPAVDDTGSHSDPVDTELGKAAEVEEEHKDEGMKVEMVRKNADDTEIKLISDMKVEVLEPKPEIADVEAEDGGGLDLAIKVKESEPVTASEMFEPLVEGIVAAELDSGTDIEIRSAQQPEYPIGNELVPATEKEIEENHVNNSETKSGFDIVFVDTEGRRESGSSVEVEDLKEPEIQENHDNSSRTKSVSDTTDMKVGQEDKPDTIVVTTENQNESELHKDEGMKVDMQGKNDDNTEIKLVFDMKEVPEPKPEIAIVDTQDQEELESPVEVKEVKTIIVAESVEPVVDETANVEVETAAEVEVDPSQQPEHPATKDDKAERKKSGYIPEEFVVKEANSPELESSEEVESTVNAEVTTAAEVEEFVIEENYILELQSSAGVEPTVNAELETAAELKVDPSWQLEHQPAADGKVEEEEEERKELGSVLEELKTIRELESPTEVKPTVDAEEIKKPEGVIEEDDNADDESGAKLKDESRQEPGVEDDEVVIEATHIPDLESPPKVKTNAGIKVDSRQNPEDMDVDNDGVEAEERKEEGSVLEEAMPKGSNITELEFAGEVEFKIEEEENRVPESMVLEANNLAKPDSEEALRYVADVEPTEALVKGSTIPGLMKTTELCPTTEIVTIDHVTGMQSGSENGSESVEREFKASSTTEENPSTDMDDDEESSHEQTTAAEVTGALLDNHVVKRHLVYLIKVPRFTDEELEKKIQKSVMELTEKTQIRESIQEDIRNKLVKLAEIEQEHQDASAYEDAEQAVFDAKNKELEDARVLVNRINNVTSIIDIDEKIRSMVHRQQHETIDLKEEKCFIREINQLKRLREEISLNKPSQEQIDVALAQRTEAYARLEKLRKELTTLREVLKSATSDRKQIRWKIRGEQDLIRGLREQYKVANAVRQEAYIHLKELRKQSAEKFKHFSMYKADHNAAVTYRVSGDNEGLRSHCSRQVERFMELWKNDEDFRREYVRSNVHSTLRRLGTLDGRSLGPGEEAPVVSSHANKKPTGPLPSSNVERSTSLVASRGKSEALATKQVTRTNHVPKVKSSMKPTTKEVLPQMKDEREARLEELAMKEEELARKEEEQRKEKAAKEEELRKKKAAEEEQLRKEKAAAEAKEKLILEQKAKFKEAEERKRRKAEKAQAKADRRERKEVELKQQKKAKKEMKKSYAQEAGNRDVGGLAIPATATNPSTASSPQEAETTVASTSKRRLKSVVAAKQYDRVQPLPLPLRNRGKRKMTTWMWVILTTLLVLLLFFAGNYVSLSNFSGF